MQWFYNLKIGKKLIISFIIVAILTGVADTFAILNLSQINKDYKEMYATNGSPLGDLGNTGIDFQINRLIVRSMVGADAEVIAAGKKQISETDIVFQQNVEKYASSLRSEEDNANYNNLVATANEYIENRNKVIALAEQGATTVNNLSNQASKTIIILVVIIAVAMIIAVLLGVFISFPSSQ